jgi:hypothetical protein
MVVTDEGWERRRARVPIGRLGEPRDVANAAVFLAGEESSFITGDILLSTEGLPTGFREDKAGSQCRSDTRLGGKAAEHSNGRRET